VDSFAALWEIFFRIVTESKLGPVGVIVDAIDECEPNTRRLFLQAIKQLVQEARRATRRSRTIVKFLFTSRPSALDLSIFDESENNVLSIDGNQARISEEIRLVIRNKLGRIASKLGCSAGTIDEMEGLLTKKAEKSFLWLHIVLKSLEDSPSTSKRDLRRIINDFPQELEATYAEFLYRIPEGGRSIASTVLQLLLGSSRHLTLDELNIAYTIGGNQEDYRTVVEVREDSQTALGQMLQRIVGPFVRIEAHKVSLIHQSVKDFLTGYALSSPDKTVRDFGISTPTAALKMASTCIRYLSLEDFETDVFTLQGLPWDEDDTTASAEEDTKLSPSLFDFCIDMNGGTIMDAGDGSDERIRGSIAERYMFYDYAATHWAEHYAQCETIADESTREAFRKLTQPGSGVLTNWLKYYWFEMGMEYSLPDYFDTVMVAAFFDCAASLDECLRMPTEQISKDRALFWAARMGSAKSAKVLLEHGANPNSRVVYLYTPLTIAAHHGHLEVVRILLLDTRIEVNAEGPSGRAALSYAAGNSHLEIFQMLFSRNDCQPEHEDNNLWTALFWAMERDHTVIGRALLAHKAVDVNHVDRHGRSILSWAAGEGFLQALEMLLKQPGVDVNLQDTRGRSPLLWAANNGQGEAIDVLMRDKYNVDRQSKDKDGRSALSLACGGGHTDCVRALIKYRCGDVNEEDVSGWTPLAWALDRQSPSTVGALLDGREVNLDHQDQSKRTALLWAAVYGYYEVVEMLLQQGANPHITDAGGHTPLDHAEVYGRTEISSLLKKAMLAGT
jgi:ankyrin repeat protein